MKQSQYKYLSQTDFKCFAEHYNEMVDAVYNYIMETEDEQNREYIIINNIAMDIINNNVDVEYCYTYDIDGREIQIPFGYFDNL